MASKRVTMLKWRLVKGEWRAGPFSIVPANNGVYLKFDGGYCNGAFPFASDEFARRACEILASRILGAMK